MDINDNNPAFETKVYQVSVAENAEVGTKLTQIIAHDLDEGANADISYDFVPEHGKLSNIFGIDSESGWITTLVELDRETSANYTFNITATDRGTQFRLRDVTTVYVTVTGKKHFFTNVFKKLILFQNTFEYLSKKNKKELPMHMK